MYNFFIEYYEYICQYYRPKEMSLSDFYGYFYVIFYSINYTIYII